MNTNINPSLQKKTAARMAAVQGLYRFSMTQETLTPSEQVAHLKTRLTNNKEEQKLLVGLPVEPNYTLLETLLTGIGENQEEIDHRLDGALSGQWTRARMSPLLIALLQCAIFELFFSKEINPKIVIDEYTRLTRSFFADAEVDFVHGALNTLVQKYG